MVGELVHIPAEPSGPPPVFPAARRGYERGAVNAYVHQVEAELAELRFTAETVTMEHMRLTDARERFEAQLAEWEPTGAAAGQRAARLMRQLEEDAAAQTQSLVRERRLVEQRLAEQRTEAERVAGELLAAARHEATSLVAHARATAEDTLLAAQREAHRVQAQLLADQLAWRAQREVLERQLHTVAAQVTIALQAMPERELSPAADAVTAPAAVEGQVVEISTDPRAPLGEPDRSAGPPPRSRRRLPRQQTTERSGQLA